MLTFSRYPKNNRSGLRCPKCGNFSKSGIIACLTLLFFLCVGVHASEKSFAYFYSSGANINYFSSLKAEFDQYLSGFGDYEFQPFDNRVTFEQHIENKTNCVIFLSSWHYSRICKTHELTPVLVGVFKGKNSQKRIIVTTDKYAADNGFVKGPMASASSIEHTRSVLHEMSNIGEAADTIRIITVPKDIDAVMAVGYDMAKSAFTTETAMDKLKSLDPVLPGRLKTVAEGKESLMLIVAAPEKISKHAESLVNIIRNMPNDPEGANIIGILHLDGWKKIDSRDKAELEGK